MDNRVVNVTLALRLEWCVAFKCHGAGKCVWHHWQVVEEFTVQRKFKEHIGKAELAEQWQPDASKGAMESLRTLAVQSYL